MEIAVGLVVAAVVWVTKEIKTWDLLKVVAVEVAMTSSSPNPTPMPGVYGMTNIPHCLRRNNKRNKKREPVQSMGSLFFDILQIIAVVFSLSRFFSLPL